MVPKERTGCSRIETPRREPFEVRPGRFEVAKNPVRFRSVRARFSAISECHPILAGVDPFRPGRIIILRGGGCGELRLRLVLRQLRLHPFMQPFHQRLAVLLMETIGTLWRGGGDTSSINVAGGRGRRRQTGLSAVSPSVTCLSFLYSNRSTPAVWHTPCDRASFAAAAHSGSGIGNCPRRVRRQSSKRPLSSCRSAGFTHRADR